LIVVSDTSPILNLARIGHLQLLPLLYGSVLIPSAVLEELTASKYDLPLP
jgi:predicted nucleic acid-binding protein